MFEGIDRCMFLRSLSIPVLRQLEELVRVSELGFKWGFLGLFVFLNFTQFFFARGRS